MDLDLKHKVAIITGAGSQKGFGKATALTLTQEGCDVVVVDKDQEGAVDIGRPLLRHLHEEHRSHAHSCRKEGGF